MDYGATITGELDFHPADAIIDMVRLNQPNARKPLAFVKVDGKPTAGAGMALFAGVGFSVNGFTAKIGIEGTIHLGDVFIDAHAGSGVGLGTEIDDRPPPDDFTNLGTGNNLIPPKRLVADLQYSAGLGAGVRDVLSGDIAVKLKIKIAFFSKSWRKRLFSFKGFCARPAAPNNEDFIGAPCDTTLISAEGTSDAAGGFFGWGAVRSEMPFPELSPLTTTAPAGTELISFDRVQEFYYDSLCTCINNNNPDETRNCFRNDDCCPATPICFNDPENPAPIPSCKECRGHDQTCRPQNGNGDCCFGQQCLAPIPSRPDHFVCSGPLDCGQACTNNNQCMTGLTCRNGICDVQSTRCHPA
jgi:hypothetical protein